jgi:hypothetical protein
MSSSLRRPSREDDGAADASLPAGNFAGSFSGVQRAQHRCGRRLALVNKGLSKIPCVQTQGIWQTAHGMRQGKVESKSELGRHLISG